MEKENVLHIAKAIILFALMLIWFTIKIYSASLTFTVVDEFGVMQEMDLNGWLSNYWITYFDYIFKVQPQTLIVSGLFGALGILELLSIKK